MEMIILQNGGNIYKEVIMNQWRILGISIIILAGFVSVCFAIDPVTLAALITGGTTLIGGGISGIGAGMSAEKQREQQRLKDEADRAEREKQQRIQNMFSERQMGMQGIELLAALQSQAMQNTKGMKFRDALYTALRG